VFDYPKQISTIDSVRTDSEHLMGVDRKFDELADTYEKAIRRKIPQYDELQRVFFNLLPFKGGEKINVLDLGLGTGKTAVTLLQHYPSANFVGVDASGRMIERARVNLRDFASRMKLIHGDFRDLPRRRKFGLVYSILAVHHLPPQDKKTLFKKVWSLLKPGGLFLLIDVVKGSSDRLTEQYVDLTFPFDEEDKPSSLMEHIRWLQSAGFKIIDVPFKYYKLACLAAFKS
jgi:tRNA (cmo5U34)-methyltransferase